MNYYQIPCDFEYLQRTNQDIASQSILQLVTNQIPSLLEKEYARGKKEATVELEKENKYATELLKKDFQNTIDRQNDKIESLQEEVKKSNLEKESLQGKLDQAYIQIKEMQDDIMQKNTDLYNKGTKGGKWIDKEMEREYQDNVDRLEILFGRKLRG